MNDDAPQLETFAEPDGGCIVVCNPDAVDTEWVRSSLVVEVRQ